MRLTVLSLSRPRALALPAFKGEPCAATSAVLLVDLGCPGVICIPFGADNDNGPGRAA